MPAFSFFGKNEVKCVHTTQYVVGTQKHSNESAPTKRAEKNGNIGPGPLNFRAEKSVYILVFTGRGGLRYICICTEPSLWQRDYPLAMW